MRAAIHTHDAATRHTRELEQTDPKGRSLVFHYDFGNFTKFVAKVSYCYAYFFMGKAFTPLILDLILADRDDCTLGPYFVGTAFAQLGVAYPPLPTKYKFSTVVRTEQVDAQTYVIARSQFFNDRGMPIYDVVVGTVDPLDQ